MRCEFQIVPGSGRVRCARCGGVARADRLPESDCPANARQLNRAAGPGHRLTDLLAEIGIAHEPGCHCGPQTALLDAGQATVEQTLSVMRTEAEKRGLWFAESQARWLIDLAIKLAAENREPTRLERVRLRLMRSAVIATHRFGRLK